MRDTEYTNKKELVRAMVSHFEGLGVDMLDIEQFLCDAVDALERERTKPEINFE